MLTAFLLSVVASTASSQSLDGTWVGWIEASDFIGALRFDIGPAGSTMTMMYAGQRRQGAVENIKLENGAVSWDAKVQPNSRMRGTLTGSTITGTFDMISRTGSVQGTGTWEVRKVDPTSIKEPKAAEPPPLGRDFKFPEPKGKFSIGRRYFYWTDDSRGESITDDTTDKRKVFVQLWYPADRAEPNALYTPFIRLEMNGPDAETWATFTAHAKQDASFVRGNEKFPLIVFSPGLGASPFRYTFIIEHLVSNGYAVAAINHPYDTAPFKFSDGTVIAYDRPKWEGEASEEKRRQFADARRLDWARDVSFVVDRLKTLDIAARLDLEKLGMAGHSFGGHTASIVCAADPRFKACANFDGLAQGSAILPDAAGATIKQPFMFFTKASDVTDLELKLMGISREEYRDRDRKRLIEKFNPSYKARMAEVPSGSWLLILPGATHGYWSDSLFMDTSSTRSMAERAAIAEAINRYILAFFDKYLRGATSTALDDTAKRKDGVIVQFVKK